MARYLYLLLSISTVFASCARDAHLKSILIGKQVWMMENLSTIHFRNGDPITQAKTQEEWVLLGRQGKPAWCYPMNKEENGAKYGKLYNWYAANDPRGIAPDGWHVPTDEEWKQLTDFLGGEIAAAYTLRESGLNNGTPGFGGQAGGGCKYDGSFFGFGQNGNWWTSTASNDEFAWIRKLNYVQCEINSIPFSKQSGCAIRCIKDKN